MGNLFVLLILLMFFTILFYIITGQDILSPTVVSLLVYIVALAFSCMGMAKWTGVEIDPLVVVIILAALFAMSLGECFVRIIVNKRQKKRNVSSCYADSEYKIIILPHRIKFVFLVVSCVGCFLYANQMAILSSESVIK